MAADWAANTAKQGMCLSGWVNLPPSSLVFILNKDGLPLLPFDVLFECLGLMSHYFGLIVSPKISSTDILII